MTKSVYIIGGPGSGKSTFTAQLLSNLGWITSPDLVDLHSRRNATNLVTLRGHFLIDQRSLTGKGIYLGVMREQFPGTDGLDRVCHETGVEWLQKYPLPDALLAEGATLATTKFLATLHMTTDLLVVHLNAHPIELERRFKQRGSSQNMTWVKGRVTAAANRAQEIRKLGGHVLNIDTVYPDALDFAYDFCEAHLVS